MRHNIRHVAPPVPPPLPISRVPPAPQNTKKHDKATDLKQNKRSPFANEPNFRPNEPTANRHEPISTPI
jgi:hypothetical protein